MTLAFKALDQDFIRFSAIDGALLSSEELADYSRRCIHPLTIGEIGCFLSHRALWQKIANDDAPFSAIFEDDVQISSRLGDFLTAIAQRDVLPAGADMVKLETMSTIAQLVRQPAARVANVDLKRLLSRHMGAAGYILTKSTAKYLADQAEMLVFPADYIFVNDLPQFRPLVVLQTVPALVVQDNYHRGSLARSGFGSTIDQMSSVRKANPLSVPAKIRREMGRGVAKLGNALRWYGSLRWRREQRLRIPFSASDALKL